MSDISSNSVIHKNAVLGENVTVGSYTVIDENVKIGDDSVVGPGVHLTGWTDIGKNTRIHNGATIGDEPQDLSYKGERSFVQIGDNNIFRECVTIHRGTEPDTKTIIGNDNMFMVYSHVGHNCIVGNNVIMVNSSSLGGYVTIHDNVFVSACAQVHQFCMVGRFVMVAPHSKIGNDVPPFLMVSGPEPAYVRGLNVVGLRRNDFNEDDRNKIKQVYRKIYQSDMNVSNALLEIDKDSEFSNNIHVKEFTDFIRNAKRGICGRKRK